MVWQGSRPLVESGPKRQYFDKHPENYSLTVGKRHPIQLCLTNSVFVLTVAKQWKELVLESPGAIVTIGQNDGFGGWCECPKCKALDEVEGSRSATALNFVNQVADIVGEEFPDAIIGTWAYLYTQKPPKTIRPRQNVIVMICTIQNCLSHPVATDDIDHTMSFCDYLAGWSKLTDRLYVWDYVICFHHFLLPFPNLDVIQPNVKFYVDNGSRGVFYQGARSGEMKELRNYVMAKCLWNPSIDARKVMDEFLETYYGPAAPPIREYLDMLHKKVRDENIHLYIWSQPDDAYLTPEIISRADELFDEAERLVEGQADLLNRVQIARLSVQYVKLCNGTGKDLAAVFEKFRAIVEREMKHEKVFTYYGEHAPMAGWLAEKEALYGRLPKNVVYDLFQNSRGAKVENCQIFETTSIQEVAPVREAIFPRNDSQMFLGILQHPPAAGVGDATYEVSLPAHKNGEKLVLRFGTCFKAPTANGVRFAVLVDGNAVWSGEQKDLAPVDHQLDLSSWAGKTILLTLRVDAMGDAAYDHSCWVRPQIQTVGESDSK